MSCLLYPLSYIALVGMVAFCAGTRSSSAAARQCGYNHNRWRKTLTKTSVMMGAHDGHGRSSNSVRRGRRTDLRLPRRSYSGAP
jgi:hypothetical protein